MCVCKYALTAFDRTLQQMDSAMAVLEQDSQSTVGHLFVRQCVDRLHLCGCVTDTASQRVMLLRNFRQGQEASQAARIPAPPPTGNSLVTVPVPSGDAITDPPSQTAGLTSGAVAVLESMAQQVLFKRPHWIQLLVGHDACVTRSFIYW